MQSGASPKNIKCDHKLKMCASLDANVLNTFAFLQRHWALRMMIVLVIMIIVVVVIVLQPSGYALGSWAQAAAAVALENGVGEHSIALTSRAGAHGNALSMPLASNLMASVVTAACLMTIAAGLTRTCSRSSTKLVHDGV